MVIYDNRFMMLFCWRLLVILSLTLLIHASDDFPLQWLRVSTDPPSTNITVISSRHSHNLYVVHTTEPWSLRVSSPLLQKTSLQTPDCRLATNAGPFHADGTGVGLVVVNHTVLHQEGEGGVGFGLSSDSSQWVLGYLLNDQATSVVRDFVTGFGWLVYKGRPVRQSTEDPERSARTAIGVDQSGRLILVVADGCEKCPWHPGWTLHELATILIERAGVYYAMTMDGGGSSVLVEYGKVRSRPTCLDVPWICERDVASVFCVGAPSRETTPTFLASE